jgi:purine-nucleoside phosphorylase
MSAHSMEFDKFLQNLCEEVSREWASSEAEKGIKLVILNVFSSDFFYTFRVYVLHVDGKKHTKNQMNTVQQDAAI